MLRALVTAWRQNPVALALVLASCSGQRAADIVFDAGAAIDDTAPGTLVLEAQLEPCPRIAVFGIAPLQVGVGGTVKLLAEARDGERPAGGVSYRWTASTGTFAHAQHARTTYRCTSAGVQTLHLVVENRRGCIAQRDALVTCVPAL